MENNRPNKVPITRLTKFFDDIDFDLEIGFGREYMEGDLNMIVVLYSVDIEKTDTDDVYKEVNSQDIRFFPPIELQVNLEIVPGDNQTYNANSMKFWTVVNDGKIFSDNEHTVFGYKGATRTVECTTVDPNEFEGI